VAGWIVKKWKNAFAYGGRDGQSKHLQRAAVMEDQQQV
jgi:hypothetical protein